MLSVPLVRLSVVSIPVTLLDIKTFSLREVPYFRVSVGSTFRFYYSIMRSVILLIVASLLGLVSCSSDKKQSDASGKGMTSFERRIRMPDASQQSRFQKEFDTGSNGKGDYFSGKGFKTSKFAGLVDYKTTDFSQAGKKSNWGSKLAQWGSKGSNIGEKTFGTKDSSMGQKSAQMGDKTYSGAGDSFKTGNFQPATKSLSRDLRPQIFGTGAEGPVAYSEEDIARLINR
jgi:hypothetical protein